MSRRHAFAASVLGLAFAACAGPRVPAAPAPPPFLTGAFVDDYDDAFAITPDLWAQLPHGRFHIVRWNVAHGYLVAQNDSANTHAPGLWTRIDWVRLEGMSPYDWAFCMSAYEAPTAEAAEATTTARRETPRTGCNGHPFSRMRRP